MNASHLSSQESDPYPGLCDDLEHLLAGLERQKEDLGPIADELISLLRPVAVIAGTGWQDRSMD